MAEDKNAMGKTSYCAPAGLAAIALCATSLLCQQLADTLSEARTFLQDGRLAEAERTTRHYIQDYPSSADAHFLLGFVLFREKEATESLAEYTEGAKYQRPGAGDLKIVASDYVLLNDFGDADKWFTEAIVEKPDDADAWYWLGRTKYNENAFSQAVTSFQRSLTLRPKNVEAENNLGLAWSEQNEREKAREAFRTAIDWEGTQPSDAQPFLNLGTLYVDENQHDMAMPYLLKAAELSPENPKVHEELSDVYAAQQKLPNAQSELERAVALAPDTFVLHFKLARMYRREGKQEQAQKEFEICESLNKAHSSSQTPNPLHSDPSSAAPR
jgi:tetratricopeptide (TPR) repeat protein